MTWGYCRRENSGRPCFKVLDCWWEIFDVEGYLRSALPETEFRSLCASCPPPKVATLVDLIRRAQRNVSGNGE